MNKGSQENAQARQANVPIAPRLLDLQGAAAYLSVSVWTVRDMMDSGRLQRVRLPLDDHKELRKILLDRLDLDQLIDLWKDVNPDA